MRKYPKLNSIDSKELDIGLSPRVQNTYAKNQRPLSSRMFFSSKKGRGGKKGSFVNLSGTSSNYKQNCTVKASYRETKEQHYKNLEYIQKEGKAKDGEKPVLYGSVSEEEYQNKMVAKNWRLIISPESNKINLTTLSKELIKRIEESTGYKLNWIAANHYDTDNHHTHILINGIDQKGRGVDLFKSKGFGSQIIREYAKDICTSMIGKRSKNDLEEKLEYTTRKNYFTQLDKTLETYLQSNILNNSFLLNKNELHLQKRLEHLQKLGLVLYNKNKQQFEFKDNWQSELKLLGKYNTYYDGFNYANCSPEKYTLHEVKKDGRIKGVILKKYTMQKDSNNFALVLKKEDGSVSYVPLPFYPKDCFIGDKIQIDSVQNKIKLNKYKK